MKAAFLALAFIGLACETRDESRWKMAEPMSDAKLERESSAPSMPRPRRARILTSRSSRCGRQQ